MIASTKKLSLLVIFVSLCLGISVSAVWAKGKTGAGGEPGAGCGFPSECTVKYTPPPFVGTIAGNYDGVGSIYLYTPADIDQVGKGGCILSIPPGEFFISADGLPENPNDINGVCNTQISSFVREDPPDPPGGCGPYYPFGALEVVGAGNLVFSPGNSFTVHVVIMPLNVICP
jgi:hypothetical protein